MNLDVIYNEDCLHGMQKLPDKSVDMVLCDLPYGTTQNKWDAVIPTDLLWESYARIIKPHGAIVLTSSQPFTTQLIASSTVPLKESLVWEKDLATGHLNANKMHMRAHEDVLMFCYSRPVYNPQKTLNHNPMHSSTRKGNGGCYGTTLDLSYGGSTSRFPRSVIKFNTHNNNSAKLRPTQKPVPLFEYLIRTYTGEGGVVLDNCMGSGTTAIACINSGRRYVGFEKDPECFRLAQDRIDSHVGMLPSVASHIDTNSEVRI